MQRFPGPFALDDAQFEQLASPAVLNASRLLNASDQKTMRCFFGELLQCLENSGQGDDTHDGYISYAIMESRLKHMLAYHKTALSEAYESHQTSNRVPPLLTKDLHSTIEHIFLFFAGMFSPRMETHIMHTYSKLAWAIRRWAKRECDLTLTIDHDFEVGATLALYKKLLMYDVFSPHALSLGVAKTLKELGLPEYVLKRSLRKYDNILTDHNGGGAGDPVFSLRKFLDELGIGSELESSYGLSQFIYAYAESLYYQQQGSFLHLRPTTDEMVGEVRSMLLECFPVSLMKRQPQGVKIQFNESQCRLLPHLMKAISPLLSWYIQLEIIYDSLDFADTLTTPWPAHTTLNDISMDTLLRLLLLYRFSLHSRQSGFQASINEKIPEWLIKDKDDNTLDDRTAIKLAKCNKQTLFSLFQQSGLSRVVTFDTENTEALIAGLAAFKQAFIASLPTSGEIIPNYLAAACCLIGLEAVQQQQYTVLTVCQGLLVEGVIRINPTHSHTKLARFLRITQRMKSNVVAEIFEYYAGVDRGYLVALTSMPFFQQEEIKKHLTSKLTQEILPTS